MRFKKLAEVVCPSVAPKTPTVADDIVGFLAATRDDDVPLYASGVGGYFVYGVIVREHHLVGAWRDDVMEWNFRVPGGYGYAYRVGRNDVAAFEIADPFDHSCSHVLDQGEATVFLRDHPNGHSYIEPNQRLTHVLGLHHKHTQSAWVRFNHLGEEEALLRMSEDKPGWLCTLDRALLDDYLVASSSCLVRVVDFVQPNLRNWDAEPGPNIDDHELEIHLRTRILTDGKLGRVRGFDVLRAKGAALTAASLRLQGIAPRQYETFVIHDWKNNRVVEWSSDPKQLGNYFVDSDLPFETSPVFFKPGVLSQYRIDPTRFRVLPDRIECVGAWSLSYDANEEEQVHVYIVDLAHIPHEEQLRWKAFNEAPKAAIARRAFERDFNARWDREYDPLVSLRAALDAFPKATEVDGPILWSLGATSGTRGADVLGYVHADNRKEFEDQIAVLAQVLVEGLHTSEINKLADAHQCRDKQLASLRQLGRIMEVLKIDASVRTSVIEPLVEVYKLRSSGVAHKGTNIPNDFRDYHRKLLARCDEAMRAFARLVNEGTFKSAASGSSNSEG